MKLIESDTAMSQVTLCQEDWKIKRGTAKPKQRIKKNTVEGIYPDIDRGRETVRVAETQDGMMTDLTSRGEEDQGERMRMDTQM